MRISDWSSDVGSSDLVPARFRHSRRRAAGESVPGPRGGPCRQSITDETRQTRLGCEVSPTFSHFSPPSSTISEPSLPRKHVGSKKTCGNRSEEHTSELQSIMRRSYDVFCFKTKITYETT